MECSRAVLYAWPEKQLTDAQIEKIQALVARREKGEPIAYLLGEAEFWSLALRVTTDTLIPRPETELLVEAALARMNNVQSGMLVDVGTGSGAIALALASERKNWNIVATDTSWRALQVAKENRDAHHLTGVRFLEARWLSPFKHASLDIVVSNPPYIAPNDSHLAEGDVRFEPRSALISDDNGLNDIRHLVGQGMETLKPGGWLLLEHGWYQGNVVQSILQQAGYVERELLQDLAGHDRVSLGRKPE